MLFNSVDHIRLYLFDIHFFEHFSMDQVIEYMLNSGLTSQHNRYMSERCDVWDSCIIVLATIHNITYSVMYLAITLV